MDSEVEWSRLVGGHHTHRRCWQQHWCSSRRGVRRSASLLGRQVERSILVITRLSSTPTSLRLTSPPQLRRRRRSQSRMKAVPRDSSSRAVVYLRRRRRRQTAVVVVAHAVVVVVVVCNLSLTGVKLLKQLPLAGPQLPHNVWHRYLFATIAQLYTVGHASSFVTLNSLQNRRILRDILARSLTYSTFPAYSVKTKAPSFGCSNYSCHSVHTSCWIKKLLTYLLTFQGAGRNVLGANVQGRTDEWAKRPQIARSTTRVSLFLSLTLISRTSSGKGEWKWNGKGRDDKRKRGAAHLRKC